MENKTTYNFIKVTCNRKSYVECWIAYYIWRTVPFCLLVVGTLGNLLNFVVLFRKRIRKYSTSMYLLFLSGTDMLVLWSGTAVDINESLNGTLIKDTSGFSCRFSRFIIIASAGFSAWLLVLMTLERIFLSMKHLVTYPKMTPKFALAASTVLLLVIILFTSHLIFGFHFNEVSFAADKSNASYDVTITKCLYTSEGYKVFYRTTWGALILIFLNIIPVIIIVCGNVVIVYQISKYHRKLQRIFPETTTTGRKKQRKAPARMLFLISGIFLVTTLPYTIYLVVKSELRDLDEHSIAKHQLLTAVLLMLLYTNFALNFFLYFVSGALFKQEWQVIVIEVYEKCRTIALPWKQSRTNVIHLQNLR